MVALRPHVAVPREDVGGALGSVGVAGAHQDGVSLDGGREAEGVVGGAVGGGELCWRDQASPMRTYT